MFIAVFSDEFKKQLAKLKKRDKTRYDQLRKKIKSILLEPKHQKHLRNVLKGHQRVKMGPLVLKFKTHENTVEFITLDHHDKAY